MHVWTAVLTNGYEQVNISWVQQMQEVINGRLLPSCSSGILLYLFRNSSKNGRPDFRFFELA